jgi:hypothetical protein
MHWLTVVMLHRVCTLVEHCVRALCQWHTLHTLLQEGR